MTHIEDLNRLIIQGFPVIVKHDYTITGRINHSLMDRVADYRAMTAPYTSEQYEHRIRMTRTKTINP